MGGVDPLKSNLPCFLFFHVFSLELEIANTEEILLVIDLLLGVADCISPVNLATNILHW